MQSSGTLRQLARARAQVKTLADVHLHNVNILVDTCAIVACVHDLIPNVICPLDGRLVRAPALLDCPRRCSLADLAEVAGLCEPGGLAIV